MDLNQNLLASDLHIDPVSHTHLRETSKWAKFLGIIGFVISVLLVIFALFAGTFMSKMPDPSGTGAAMMGAGAFAVIFVIAAIIYFILSLYLYRFAVKMKVALDSTDQESLASSFQNLKITYRILGIIVIVYFAFLILSVLLGVLAAVMN